MTIVVGGDYNSTGAGSIITQPYINIVRTQDDVNNITVVGTGDDQLWPPSPLTPQPITGGVYEGYKKVGYLDNNRSLDITLVDGIDTTGALCPSCDMVIPEDGVYRVDGFTTFQHSANTSTVAFSFAVETPSGYIWSPRPVKHRVPNTEGHANMAGEGILPVTAGTKISLWVASDNSGTLALDTLSIIIAKFAEL